MKLDQIIQKNREYNEWKVQLEKLLQDRKNYIEDINKQINKEEFKELGYDKAKETYDEIKFNIEYKENRPQIENLIKQLKEEKYEIMKVAHYYPEINNIKILSDDKKRKLDEVIFKFRNNYLLTHSNAWYNLRLTEEEKKEVFEYLYNLGILSKNYEISCECGEETEIITEQNYLEHKKYFEIAKKKKEKTATEDEIIWFQDFSDCGGNRIWTVDCFHCDGLEINNFSDLDQGYIIYKINKSPDMTYASK